MVACRKALLCCVLPLDRQDQFGDFIDQRQEANRAPNGNFYDQSGYLSPMTDAEEWYEWTQLIEQAEAYEIRGPDSEEFEEMHNGSDRDFWENEAARDEARQVTYLELLQDKKDERAIANKAWYRKTRVEQNEQKVRRHYWE